MFIRKYFCNPINFTYRYQFNQKEGGFSLNREAADPSMILFKGKYYIFPSMTRGFLVSEDMADWRQYPLTGVPLYDYAPDVRVIGDWMYFCASRRGEVCDFYRTKNPETGIFERIPGLPSRGHAKEGTASWLLVDLGQCSMVHFRNFT